MRKLLPVAALVGTLFAARPAEACRGNNPCPLVIEAFAAALGTMIIGSYVGATGYFAYRDLTDEQQTLKYGAAELAFNGSFAALYASIAIENADKGDSVAVPAVLGATHTALALHGAWTIKEEWRDPGHAPDGTKEWIVGIGYGANALLWTAMLPGKHGRTYGIVEASVNGPMALGFGYLAVQSARDGDRSSTLLFGGMAALSTAFTYHGLKTAIDPPTTPGLDLLEPGTGTDTTSTRVTPAAVSTGGSVAPGLAVSGTW